MQNDIGKIIQVIPATAPTKAIYATRGVLDGFAEVRYLALTDHGEVYGLVNGEGWYEIVDSYSNFSGLCEGDIRKYMKENGIQDTNGLLEGLECY